MKLNFISIIACRDAKDHQKQEKKQFKWKEKIKEQLNNIALGN